MQVFPCIGEEASVIIEANKMLQQFVKARFIGAADGTLAPIVFKIKMKKPEHLPGGALRVIEVKGVSPQPGKAEEAAYVVFIPFVEGKATAAGAQH